MRFSHRLSRALAGAALVALSAATAAAQTGRVGGTVKDEAGNPIKGATVTAENPSASPSSFTAITDDKGRFSIIGMRSGQWTFTATMQCTNGAVSGSINATWDGSRYVGTWTWGSGGGTVRVERGLVDTQCQVP